MTAAQDTAVERAGKIFARLRQAAERREPCPSNAILAERFGCGTTAIVNALHFLASSGMIHVERGNCWRIVTIVATGKKTVMPVRERTGDAEDSWSVPKPKRLPE